MKVSVIADCHLNKSIYKGVPDKKYTDLPFRNVDFMNAFEYIIDENINAVKPDLIVIAGDVYDTFDPSNIVRSFFNGQIKKVSEAKIPIVIMVGNHDICRKHNSLQPLAALGLKNVKIVESPKTVTFKDKLLAFFPYSAEVERGDISIKNQFNQFVSKINEEAKVENKEIMFFGHFGVKGAVLNQYVEDSFESSITNLTTTLPVQIQKDFTNSNEKDISLADLDAIGAKYVFLGDYHRHQILNTKKCIAMYTGSIEKSNMTEISQQKGFVVYDSEANDNGIMGKCKFIEYPNCRPMIELIGTIHDIESKFENMDKTKLQGAIVKIVFIGNEDELTSFSIKSEPFKKKLAAEINPIHVFHVQKVIDEAQANEASAIEVGILERGHILDDDVLVVVEEMTNEKIKNSEEASIIFGMAKEIWQENKEKTKKGVK